MAYVYIFYKCLSYIYIYIYIIRVPIHIICAKHILAHNIIIYIWRGVVNFSYFYTIRMRCTSSCHIREYLKKPGPYIGVCMCIYILYTMCVCVWKMWRVSVVMESIMCTVGVCVVLESIIIFLPPTPAAPDIRHPSLGLL